MTIINQHLTLKDLPLPSNKNKTGFPWDQESTNIHDILKFTNINIDDLPLLSIVTPNYNQGEFIEETIRSILLQGYPKLEYIIIDGGSNDNSVEIIKKYEPFLSYWVSEKDNGQSDGINKGLRRCTGDYLIWMNADDSYLKDALQSIFIKNKGGLYDFIHGNTYCGESLETKFFRAREGTDLFNLFNLLLAFRGEKYVIPSQSVFVSKNLVKKVGFLDENLYYCMDMDWFMRMALTHPKTLKITEPLTFYRTHPNAKTVINTNQGNRKEAIALAKKYLPHLSKFAQIKLTRLIDYSSEFEAYRHQEKNKSLLNFLQTIVKYPVFSLSDTMFLGMIKKSLFNPSNL